MALERYNPEKSWTVLTEDGREAVEFQSFIDMDFANEALAPNYPVEAGSFANYNKVQSPADIRVSLALQGTDFEIEAALARLDTFSKEASKLIVVTSAAVYDSLTLTGVSYSRRAESGVTLLIVLLSFYEVRESRSQVTTTVITQPKNPTSATRVNEGRKQAYTSSAEDTRAGGARLLDRATGGGQ
jgi:hypothetical protein